MGEAILIICHPDSITTIKHWNTIIKARLEEVSSQLHKCLSYLPERQSAISQFGCHFSHKSQKLTFLPHH